MLERLDSQLVDSTPIELVLLAELGRIIYVKSGYFSNITICCWLFFSGLK